MRGYLLNDLQSNGLYTFPLWFLSPHTLCLLLVAVFSQIWCRTSEKTRILKWFKLQLSSWPNCLLRFFPGSLCIHRTALRRRFQMQRCSTPATDPGSLCRVTVFVVGFGRSLSQGFNRALTYADVLIPTPFPRRESNAAVLFCTAMNGWLRDTGHWELPWNPRPALLLEVWCELGNFTTRLFILICKQSRGISQRLTHTGHSSGSVKRWQWFFPSSQKMSFTM